MSLYEIEIKSLLGSKENADALRQKVGDRGGVLIAQNKQLNHYFTVSNLEKFKNSFGKFIPEDNKSAFEKIVNEGKNISVRTRDTDGEVKFVIKASIGDDSSSNGVSRMEFEIKMNTSIEELDQALLDSGLEYQAKWSREREEYKIGDINICLDKNAGYGYLAEFEKVVSDGSLADSTRQDLVSLMGEFGVEELKQDRLERMFAHYNANWRDYYGTDKVFNIE